MATKLNGLVVCGGESSRMGMDKSLLVYHNKPQRYQVYDILETLCDEVFISCNKKQSLAVTGGYQKIIDQDQYEHIGPMAALLSAFAHSPQSDFLVVACDYPFLKREHIKWLRDHADPNFMAACYMNTETGMKEPLLAIYRSACYPQLLEQFIRKDYSLKNFLRSVEVKNITAADNKVLTSVDTPEAYQAAMDEMHKKVLVSW